MIHNILKLLLFAAAILSCIADKGHDSSFLAKPEVVYEWDWLRFQGLNEGNSTDNWNPRNNIIFDIDFYKKDVILTVPRFRRGVPFTLVTVVDSHDDKHKHDNSPKLRPFPDAKGQTPGDCRDLQNVFCVEKDTEGRLWVLDAGAKYIYEENPDYTCPPKLIIYDLTRLGQPEVERYVFPDEVLKKDKSVLIDITLQKTGTGDKDWIAYISDEIGYGIIVFNLKKKSSYRVEDKSMNPDKKSGIIEINNKDYDFSNIGVDGIVFDKNLDKLYYTTLSGYKVYSIPGSVIRNKKLATNKNKLSHAVKVEGRKEGHSDGITADSEGRLFFGLLEKHAAAVWSPAYKLSPRTTSDLARDNRKQWVASVVIKDCWLYIVTDRVHQLKSGEGINKGEINNKVLRIYIGTQSYKEWLGQAICPQPIPVGINWPSLQHAGHGHSGKQDRNGSEEEDNDEEESKEESGEEEDEEDNNEGEDED